MYQEKSLINANLSKYVPLQKNLFIFDKHCQTSISSEKLGKIKGKLKEIRGIREFKGKLEK